MLSMLVTVAVLWHRRMLCFNRAGGGLPTKELPGSPLYTMGSGDSPGTLCADPPPSVQITVDGGATTSSLPSSEQQSVSAAGPSTSLISGVAARALQASPEQSRRTPLQQPQPAATAARRPDPELPTPFAVAMPPTTIGLVDLFGAAMFGAPGLPASKAASSTNLPPYGAGPLAQRYESAPAAVGPEDSQAVLSHLSAPEDSGIVNKLRQTLSSGAAEQQRDGSPRGPRSSDSSQLVDMDPRELQVKADGLLGQGAFGSVYRGIYQGQEVAIKVLSHVQVAGDPLMHEKDVEAFRHELRLLSQLSHPNIVRVLGGCAHRSHPFLVMELMPACLHTLIHSTQPLPVRRVLEIAKDVANGLEFLHPEIIHRDLKVC